MIKSSLDDDVFHCCTEFFLLGDVQLPWSREDGQVSERCGQWANYITRGGEMSSMTSGLNLNILLGLYLISNMIVFKF